MSVRRINETYYDITKNRLHVSSMCRMFNIYKDENNELFMNIFKTFIIDDDIKENARNFETFNVVYPWWENISYSYYGDIQSWWLACLSNDILNPFEEIEQGKGITLLREQFIPFIQRDMLRIFEQ